MEIKVHPSPQALPRIRCKSVWIKSDPLNEAFVYVNGKIALNSGDEVILPVDYADQVFLHAADKHMKVRYEVEALTLEDRERLAAEALAELIMHALDPKTSARTLKAMEEVNGRYRKDVPAKGSRGGRTAPRTNRPRKP